MTTLYIDTTYDITLGLLDDALRWRDFRRFQSAKASIALQVEAHKLLQDFSVDPKTLSHLVTVAGPGFYTGLRLSEGFADVMKFFGIPFHSFYSFDIPKWCGEASGVWMTKAYRGEYFFHHWDEQGLRNILIPAKELESYLEPLGKVFIHSDTSLDEKSRSLLKQTESTIDLLRNTPAPIFQKIFHDNHQTESFYFRAPEDEFKVST